MSVFEIARTVLLIVHLMGMAVFVGGYVLQLRATPVRTAPLLVAGAVQVVSGIALIAVRRLGGMPLIDEKMIVKLVIAASAIGAVVVLRRRQARGRDGRGWFHTAGVLAIADVLVAVVWV